MRPFVGMSITITATDEYGLPDVKGNITNCEWYKPDNNLRLVIKVKEYRNSKETWREPKPWENQRAIWWQEFDGIHSYWKINILSTLINLTKNLLSIIKRFYAKIIYK